MIEELLAARGIQVSYETVRQWCLKFGQTDANHLRSRRPRTGDQWHLGEVVLKINGRLQYLWRAVDQYGNVLDILVTAKRDMHAAQRFFRKLLNGASGKLRGCRYGCYTRPPSRTMPSSTAPHVGMSMPVPIGCRRLHCRLHLCPVLKSPSPQRKRT